MAGRFAAFGGAITSVTTRESLCALWVGALSRVCASGHGPPSGCCWPRGSTQARSRLYSATPSTAATASGVDLERYPLHLCVDRSVAYADIVQQARSSLATTGCASFPGFWRPEVVRETVDLTQTLVPDAFVTDSTHNAYQLPESDLTLPSNHVRNVQMNTRVASAAYDQIPLPLRRLYQWDGLVRFVSAVLAKRMHPLADPLGSCTINIFQSGWEHAWHFDEAEYTVTLALQHAEAGGEFEFTRPLRTTPADLAASQVAGVIRQHSTYTDVVGGDDAATDAPHVFTAPFEPGTLQIFGGRYSLHRVKQLTATATRSRFVAVLCFATEAHLHNSPAVQKMFWGRTAA
eukprot:m.215577 g.215577  ORF g.215577 m.215577 type:complete len:347 (+) comp18641_c0_seq1:1191-2231(+)